MTQSNSDKEPSQASEMSEIENIPGFKQLRLLGQGGMGSVFLAEELALSRKVALKVLHPRSNEASHSASVLAEARTLAQVNHPNVVHVYSVLEQPVSAIVMEYVAGTTLKKYQLERPLELPQKVNLLYQIAQGLEAIHQHGIVHRDIKADNILIDQSGNQPIAKLADFGISNHSIADDTNSPDKVRGSLSWMSPEQLQHQDVNASSDMFSFGLLAFQLLADKHPFDSRSGQNSADIAENIVNKKAMNAGDITPALPHELSQLINQLLHKSPENRPGSKQTSDRLQQIERMLQQSDVLSMDTQTLETVPVKKKPNKLVALVAVVLPIMLLAGYWYSQQEPETRYVAVLKPKLTETEPLSTLQKNLVLTSIEDALQQLIISTPNLMLIPQSEINEGQLDIAEIGLSTGADDIVTTELTCSDQSCEMVLSLQSKVEGQENPKWHTVNRLQHPIFLEFYHGVFQFTQTQLTNLFIEVTKMDSIHLVIAEEDYSQYLRLYNQVYTQGQYSLTTLEKVEQLLKNNAYFYPLYSLYFDTALDVYFSSNAPQVIEKAKSFYLAVPKELKTTTEYLIDGFYIAVGNEDYETARALLTQLEDMEMNISELRLLNAAYHQYTQDFNSAVNEYIEIIKIRPSALAYYHLAFNYYWLGDQELAILNLQKAKSLNTFLSKVNNFLGALYLQRGMLKETITIFQDIAEQAPGGDSFSNLALSHLLSQNYSEAKIYIEQALDFNPNHAGWLINQADILFLSGQLEEAKAIYLKILEVGNNKSDLSSLTRNAQAHLHLANLTEALKTINEAKEIAPSNPNVLYISAMILTQLNEKQSALIEVEKSIDNGIGPIWFYLPWFDSLCSEPRFSKLTQIESASITKRCDNFQI